MSATDGYVGRFRWYEKPTLMGQKLFHLPVLGWVTVFQFSLLVAVGLPGMFICLNAFGPVGAPWPLMAAFGFAKFRPPMLGYEMRIYHVLQFRMFGPREKKAGPKPKKYALPRASGKPREAKPEPDAPLEVIVFDQPREFRMSLPSDVPRDIDVEVRLDGARINTQRPDSNGTVHLTLYPDDMRGERNVTIHDMADEQLAGITMIFRQGNVSPA